MNSNLNSRLLFLQGENYRTIIQEQLVESLSLNNSLLPFYHSGEGRKQVERYLEASCTYYPQYVDELKGIAAGAEVDFIKVHSTCACMYIHTCT